MKSPAKRSERGAALLLVLAALVLVAATCAILAKAASTSNLRHQLDEATLIADDLLAQADWPIQDWLAHESAKIVLDPATTDPCVDVLHDQWSAGGGGWEHELTITAWDQCGMVDLEVARSGSPLRLVVPAAILNQVDRIKLKPGATAGLDVFLDPDTDQFQPSPFPIRPPHTANASHAVLGAGEGGGGTTAAGACIACPNSKPFRININTAPIHLVEAALRANGYGGLEQIIASRRQGKPAAWGESQVPRGHGVVAEQFAPTMVASSSLWAFRIDARIGPLRKSWWAIYEPMISQSKQPNHTSKNTLHPPPHWGGWECVQRLVITN